MFEVYLEKYFLGGLTWLVRWLLRASLIHRPRFFVVIQSFELETQGLRASDTRLGIQTDIALVLRHHLLT
jgi:hypothetical protein